MRELLLPVVAILAVACAASPDTLAIPTSCPKVDPTDETVHLAHETDCTKFYKCSNGQKHVMDCPKDATGHKLHFDPTLQVCVYPWQTNCTTQTSDCSSDGYVEPHPYNCAMYYVCENGARSLKQCDSDRLFDSKSMSCVPQADATCGTYLLDCPTRNLFDTVFLPHECKCSQYYECVNGMAVERWCETGKNFDVERRQCVAAQNAKCHGDQKRPSGVKCPSTGVKYVADKNDCGSYYECRDGASQKFECNDGLSFDPITSMCTWPPSVECSPEARTRVNARYPSEAIKRTTHAKCPPVGSARLPHECSCNIYYTCNEGKMTREECPEGLIYDYIMEQCDHPQNAVCPHSKFNPAFTFADSLKMLGVSPLAATECSTYGTERIPHESLCRYYYQCRNGQKHLRWCHEGHYFNEIIESCDLPSNTNCIDKSIESTSTNPNPVCSCPMNDCGIIRCPDERNCSWYYQCENTIAVSKKCPNGLYYDRKNQICDYPENVNCAPNQCPEGEKSHHECQCDQYYECDADGKKVVQHCPSGLYFDYERKICDFRERVKCWPPTNTTDECQGKCPKDSMERLPHEECNKYCQCNGGTGKVVTCTDHLFYNEKKKICDWPENVEDLKCDPFPCNAQSSGTLLPNECYCNLYYECRNGVKIRERCEDGKNFDYEKQRCVTCSSAHCYAKMEPEGIVDCKETCSWQNASSAIEHSDCDKYCECNECRLQVVRECGKHQYFNPEKRKCDWPENIKDLSCDPFPCLPDADENLPHECNCHLYYVCKKGKKYVESCPDGYNFDYVYGRCVTSTAHCYKKPSKGKGLGVEDSVELRCQA